METRYILTDYVGQARAYAVYDKLEDGTFAGRIPQCKGVVAFGATLRACENELRSTLEDWILVGLKLGHPLPVIAEINLNKEPGILNAVTAGYLECKKGGFSYMNGDC
jgi:predicted RNase H-like HicB family nuclease